MFSSTKKKKNFINLFFFHCFIFRQKKNPIEGKLYSIILIDDAKQ